ncbi:MAG TPA: TA system VapC family ribonuclease toxin [Bryobacteraceae bacterium]|nr:TA system VapC family ribonuclease toxin [Bryobacteraceae bacterium]
MNYLIDVNVWVALALAGHVHHTAAREWFERPQGDRSNGARLFFCRVTQKGFLRLLTNGRIMGENTLSAAGAWRYYDTLCEDDRVRFAVEPPRLEPLWRESTLLGHVDGPNIWTDAYLSAFAVAAGFTIVTFDRGFRHHRGTAVRILSART